MADTVLTYGVAAVIVVRFAGGTLIELVAAIAGAWLLLTLIQLTS